MTEFKNVYMIYCLEKDKNGDYLILNRDYKPLGFNTRVRVEYGDYPIAAKMKITKAMAIKLSVDDKENRDKIFLYNDGCVPSHSKAHMKKYMKKIELLAKLTVD